MIFGYGEQTDQALQAIVAILPVLGITAGGGLINKSIEVKERLLAGGNMQALRDVVKAEIAAATKKPDV